MSILRSEKVILFLLRRKKGFHFGFLKNQNLGEGKVEKTLFEKEKKAF